MLGSGSSKHGTSSGSRWEGASLVTSCTASQRQLSLLDGGLDDRRLNLADVRIE